MLLGTIINVVTVILGSIIGLTLRSKFPERIQVIIFQGLGLITIFLGVQMALQVENPLILIFSILIGGVIGELLHIERFLEGLGDRVKSRLKIKHSRFTEGLIGTFLLFCIGPMTIVGSLNSGLRNDHTLLLAKATLDGFTAIALSVTYGVGVLFSAIPLFLFQSFLTLSAGYTRGIFSDVVINQLTAVGGILVLGIGLGLLEIKKVKVANFLPALIVVILLTYLLSGR